MKIGDEIHELNYELIKRAVHGEPEALEEILRIYEPYHDSLVTSDVAGADGRIHWERHRGRFQCDLRENAHVSGIGLKYRDEYRRGHFSQPARADRIGDEYCLNAP